MNYLLVATKLDTLTVIAEGSRNYCAIKFETIFPEAYYYLGYADDGDSLFCFRNREESFDKANLSAIIMTAVEFDEFIQYLENQPVGD